MSNTQVDAVVIGAGITGMYQAYNLISQGLSVRGFEAGADFGGTWYWNRYPGCRLDTESYAYGYFALKGIVAPWHWSERFAGQPELLRYALSAAEAMGLRKHYQFGTQVLSAKYAEDSKTWKVALSDGSEVVCKYLLSAVGPLSATRLPNIAGIENFQGQSFHSSRWPTNAEGEPEYPDFTGKRVGVIGTGATGVQIIPIVAKSAQQLKVFQRTPNWCTPLGNHALTPQLLEQLRGDPVQFLNFIKKTETAFPYARLNKKAWEDSAEDRAALFESLYHMPGYGIWLAGYKDLLLNKDSNLYLSNYVASKIRQRVNDPVIAEKLIPKNHLFGTRRVPMETGYYEVYNQENVSLVDLSESPIQQITVDGIQTETEFHALDVIIFATGFDGVTGALDRIDIEGVDAQKLKQVWADGPVTYLGIQTRGFPNFFTLVGAHNGAAFCNVGVCGALQVEWVSQMIEHMEANGIASAEPESSAQDAWTRQVYEVYAKTLLVESDAWWVKSITKPDGSVEKRALIYVGGAPEYRKKCEEIAAAGYEGFVFTHEAMV